MDELRMLSGDELVARGTTKIDGALPDGGLKGVIPNGSWLEQKQIQSALEARKQLIEVERIEKCGVLSHAEWREELMLAEVIQNAGSHWQYLGHNVGKQLFLKPEEALFLMEVNCLQLKYNDVTVSLQQAYSLLLQSKVSILQYKVYASLSRLGYKVYRHEDKEPTEYEKKINLYPNIVMRNVNETEVVQDVIDHKGDNEKNCEVMNIVSEDVKNNSQMEVDGSVTEDCTSAESSEKAVVNECAKVDDNKKEVDNDQNVYKAVENELAKAASNKEVNKDQNMSQAVENELIKPDNNEIGIDQNRSKAVDIECPKTDNNNKDVDNNKTISKSTTVQGSVSNTDLNKPLAKTSEIGCPNDNNTVLETNNSVIGMETEDSSVGEEKNEIKINDLSGGTTPIVFQEKASDIKQDDNEWIPAHQYKLFKLKNRQLKPCDARTTLKSFEKIPDLTQNQVVTITVPEEQYIPRNVFLNNLNYVLNLESIRSKTKDAKPEANESRTYSLSEEVNGDHVRRIRDTPTNYRPASNLTAPDPHPRFILSNQFRAQHFWRPNVNYSFYYQRPFMFNMNFIHRFRPFFRPPPLIPRFPTVLDNNVTRNMPSNSRKRKGNQVRQVHLESIKQLAARLKQLVQLGNTQAHNVFALSNLIRTFNVRYNATLRLTETYDIDDDEPIVETITLDDDEERTSKRRRTGSNDKYNENLDKIKRVALKLKELESKNEANSRHRRAFSNLVKKFNKSFDAGIYTNRNYEVLDKKLITLESSSDSDCVVEEVPNASSTPSKKQKIPEDANASSTTPNKKLKNPFNILKRLSEKQTSNISSITNESKGDNKYSELVKIFGNKWLPSEDDFGKAEIPSQKLINVIDSKSEEYLFELIKNYPHQFDNWLDIKIMFLENLQETNNGIQSERVDNIPEINSIIHPEDRTDMASVLNKLRVIKTNNEIDGNSSLKIDFDVYNRDVQNFKKSKRPTPHFRVVCMSESSCFPSGKEVATLHSNYTDNVSIVFSVVGAGSISYLQINPTDLPVYIPSNDLT